MSYTDQEKHKKMRKLVVISVVTIVVIIIGYLIGVLIPRIIAWTTPAPVPPSCNFTVIYTGTGVTPSTNIYSGIMISVDGRDGFIALDAGSIFAGVRAFVENNNLLTEDVASSNTKIEFNFPDSMKSETERIGMILQNQLIGYFLGTIDLSHVLGLVMHSPQDVFNNETVRDASNLPTKKSIIGSTSTITGMQNVFDSPLWSMEPDNYLFTPIIPDVVHQVNDLLHFNDGTFYAKYFNQIKVKSYQTCQGDNFGTAYLFDRNGAQLLYLSASGGNTFNKSCNWRENMNNIWSDQFLQPLNLTALFVEVSSVNATTFGHMTPYDLIGTLKDLMTIRSLSSITSLDVYVQPVREEYASVDSAAADITSVLTFMSTVSGVDATFNFQNQGDLLCT
ncbi:hypothetical protein AKO1_009744 [Acrasis kona]|uniref:Uncharacterized protein n=1 Tax=Acrasis kona TaxID=1008807 RepID=A0AAW2ZQ29_9EUKA